MKNAPDPERETKCLLNDEKTGKDVLDPEGEMKRLPSETETVKDVPDPEGVMIRPTGTGRRKEARIIDVTIESVRRKDPRMEGNVPSSGERITVS